MTFHVPEKYRITFGRLASTPAYGNNGAFQVPVTVDGTTRTWNVIASDGDGWEHVSVSRPNQTPSWAVMSAIKALFWSEDACVVQYHPPRLDHVNFHAHCLHLWRPIGVEMPRPPAYMVGPVTC